MAFKCEICGKGMWEGLTLIRQNKNEIPARWRCRQHNLTLVHSDVKKLIEALDPGKKEGLH